MAEASSKILEGVFAIKKPPSLSSAQVLRDLQHKFAASNTFKPLLQETERRKDESGQPRKRRRVASDNVFKMGHGGTLDPLATGVLIVGIGRGTKHLINFLECTKTYETVVLFGKSTDTYDVAGKVVAEAPSKHITRNMVEEKLGHFRGKIKQVPPIYSALKINGVKAYEYARSGKELPRELESRDMQVDECSLLQWQEPGTHRQRWPATQAPEEDKAAARKLMKGVAQTDGLPQDLISSTPDEKVNSSEPAGKVDAPPPASIGHLNSLPAAEKSAMHTHDIPLLRESPADAPAVSVRLTVSSGFYVRSFAHDLGIACDSYGIMTELVRSRQSDYTSAEPVPPGLIPCLTYEELEKGEDVWGPKITRVLGKWIDNNPAPTDGAIDDRDRPENQWRSKAKRQSYQRSPGRGLGRRQWNDGNGRMGERRNSSSPE